MNILNYFIEIKIKNNNFLDIDIVDKWIVFDKHNIDKNRLLKIIKNNYPFIISSEKYKIIMKDVKFITEANLNYYLYGTFSVKIKEEKNFNYLDKMEKDEEIIYEYNN